ncbi:hypothetical protein C5167_047344 [Papaver somniferum]|uniref:Uncharacterized protein n=1 Tax=Papaver somniferum TaxID=3469 RepID=A0A4Y7LK64_PAPSO|nr:hypothetical protein C5167_047344 [Papaver somniferum]
MLDFCNLGPREVIPLCISSAKGKVDEETTKHFIQQLGIKGRQNLLGRD